MREDESMDRWSDEQLLREANNGNDEAFSKFCVNSLPRLMRYLKYHCKSLGLSETVAEDCCQDMFIKAIGSLNSRKAVAPQTRPKLSVAWLKKIAYRCLLDCKRRSGKVTAVEMIEPEYDKNIETAHIETEEQEEILKFCDWLTDNERDLIDLVYVQELGIPEAGERLNLSKENAYKIHQRALRHLLDLLTQHGSCVPTQVSD